MSEFPLVSPNVDSDRPPLGAAPRFFLGESNFSVYEEMARQLKEMGWCEVRSKGWLPTCDVILGDRFTIPYPLLRCECLPPTSRYSGSRWLNYFRGSHRLTLKASMARLLQKADSTCGEWMPRSYVLGGDQERRKDDREAFLEHAVRDPTQVWIIKPSSGCKGKDIVLTRSVAELEVFISELDPKCRRIYLVQQYVQRPLLYRGRKFDMRVWALLKSPYTIYAFTKGSCRTSSSPYDPDDIEDYLVHLTNHCLQEDAPEFGQYEEGNELWFEEVGAYLHEVYRKRVLEDRILPQIASIIIRTLLAARAELQVLENEPYQCFQLFGYDVIVDEGLSVMLLEINGSPGVASKYLQPLVREIIKLVDGGEALNEWDVDAVGFVKLWAEGDELPIGST
ncbi:tubulin-tyrosine ligase, putative [Trypanosoma equiperdum]|uniref:Tubulin--tyrosine ligase n=2 Tax=Trypanozoon TaxID=39700 RepID=Q585U6_TRYB2|nr:tubulin-tyrosine ligase, putative [Trypanosoma brucei brucei TREU927]AAQ15983.1 tubulin-tyrosine ligase, putative [Trypanosoma brucei brucei TREU927]AAX80003.1 tubulin-tyrosine ligase, putative [Trypanosoma brucei]SCU71399.1 tubulin-tyrosine ligase, putative [Trypanosoma equiperdum]